MLRLAHLPLPEIRWQAVGRVVLYARVSTQEQARSGFSIPDQKRRLLEHAAKDTVVEVISDDGVSGASEAIDRPGLRRVMDLAEAGKIDAVLATSRDRLFRSRLYRLLFERDLEDLGVSLVCLDDTGNTFGDAIRDEFATFERDQLAERSRRGKLQKVRQGKLLAAKRPKFGFRFTEDRSGLVADERNMQTVRRVFDLVASGMRVNAVRLLFNRQGVPTATGARWSAQAIRDILLDDAYRPHTPEELEELLEPEALRSVSGGCGVWWYNRRRYFTDRKTRKKRYTVRPKEEWIGVPVSGEGLPDRETVDRARENILQNRQMSRSGKRVWPLSGVARCHYCGYTLSTQLTSRKYHYYTCRSRYERGVGVCAAKVNARAEELERAVFADVCALLSRPDLLRAGIERMLEEQGPERREEEIRRKEATLTRTLDDLEAKRTRYQHLYAEDLITIDDLRDRLSELDETRREASESLEDAREALRSVKTLRRDTESLIEAYSALTAEDLRHLEPEEQHELYRRLGLTVKVWEKGAYGLESAFGPLPRKGVNSISTGFNILLSTFSISEIRASA